ncbi:hypothetical protein Hanom_Chr09g00823801 [Helianthus anomalus]
MIFFFHRAEVIPMVMQFRGMGLIPKEEIKVSHGMTWYENLMALPNQVFSEQVLVATGMSDKWPEDSENVPKLRCTKVLFHPSLVLWELGLYEWVMSIGWKRYGRILCTRLLKCLLLLRLQLKVRTFPNHRPCRAITPNGKKVVYLSSEESVASSENELNPSHDLLAGVLRNLGVDPEEKKPKRVSKKKVTVARGAAGKKTVVTGAILDDFVYVADSFEELYAIGGKPQGSMVAGARSSGRAGSRGPESGATPTSTHAEETEEDLDPEKLISKNTSKIFHDENKSEASPVVKKVAGSTPAIGKKRSLRSLYSKVSTDKCSHACAFVLPFSFIFC